MTLGIMQPYLFPYIGYFQLIAACDKFVLLDDVNYINKGWINRNQTKCGLFTLELKGASQNKLINEVEIFQHFKYLNHIGGCYDKLNPEVAKYLVSSTEFNLSKYLYFMIQHTCNYLGIKTKIIPSSSVYGKNGKGQDRILDICFQEGATRYINPIGGIDLYNRLPFTLANIELKFLSCKSANKLSIIDWLMTCSKDEIKKELSNYELI